MKINILLVWLMSLSTGLSGLDLTIKTKEENEAWHAMVRAASKGDLSPIYEAYRSRDLKFLWNSFDAGFRDSIELSKEEAAELENAGSVGFTISKAVADYAGRLLTQIPGHAKFIGDKVDLIADDPSRLTQVGRSTYLYHLAELGSDESIHEIGRFIDDPRGIPTAEDEAQNRKAVTEKRYADTAKYGIGTAYAVDLDARVMMWEARVDIPFLKDPRNRGKTGPNHTQESQKEVDDWWASAASAKYRQPLDLTGQPPEEPPPARFDIKAIYKKAKAEKPQAALPPP